MDTLCRLCGSEAVISVDIFEPGSERVKKIHKILPITVNECDPFPKILCHHCSYKVDQFFEFRTTSLKTQATFKKKVPWLKAKKPRQNSKDPPMVEVVMNSVNAVSPNEKQTLQTKGSAIEICDDDTIVIDEDSSPYIGNSNGSSSEKPTGTQKSKRTKPRKERRGSKKKKKKNESSCMIAEVFTTTEQAYENLNNIENEPLCLPPGESNGNNSFNIVENNTHTVEHPKSDINVEKVGEKGILTDDRGGDNIVLPKYILITKLPRVGNVYTCERCGRTFLNPQPASQHHCPDTIVLVEDDRSKEESQCQEEVGEDKTKDFYQCNECGFVFTRHSQLVAHEKKHKKQSESSSDDGFRPFNKRRKHHSRRKHKAKVSNTKSSIKNVNSDSNSSFTNKDSNCLKQNDDLSHTTNNLNLEPKYLFSVGENSAITRHSLLSSDSE